MRISQAGHRAEHTVTSTGPRCALGAIRHGLHSHLCHTPPIILSRNLSPFLKDVFQFEFLQGYKFNLGSKTNKHGMIKCQQSINTLM